MLLVKALNAGNKDRARPIRVVFIPTSRDELLPALAAGRGDIAAANLTITPERLKLVDFSTPLGDDVSEILVTPAGTAAPASAEGLSGSKVHVRRSSSYYSSLVGLNTRLKALGKAPVEIVPADENLEDEDILEMVNAGLIPATIVDSHIATFWKQGARGWRSRVGDPRGVTAVQAGRRRLHRQEPQGLGDRQRHPQSLPQEHEVGKERHRRG
jgi:ABC-type amino acid transport substrate-binding protein